MTQTICVLDKIYYRTIRSKVFHLNKDLYRKCKMIKSHSSSCRRGRLYISFKRALKFIKMTFVERVREKIDTTFGRGIRYPISKFNRDLDTIVKHQNKRMIDYEPNNEAHKIVSDTFLRELDEQFEKMENERLANIIRKNRYPAFRNK